MMSWRAAAAAAAVGVAVAVAGVAEVDLAAVPGRAAACRAVAPDLAVVADSIRDLVDPADHREAA